MSAGTLKQAAVCSSADVSKVPEVHGRNEDMSAVLSRFKRCILGGVICAVPGMQLALNLATACLAAPIPNLMDDFDRPNLCVVYL
jgi:hypothetical protein